MQQAQPKPLDMIHTINMIGSGNLVNHVNPVDSDPA